MVRWLGLCGFAAVARVQALVRKLRSCKACGAAKKQANKQKQKQTKHTHTQSFKLFLKREKLYL